jgi:hypothetical protein
MLCREVSVNDGYYQQSPIVAAMRWLAQESGGSLSPERYELLRRTRTDVLLPSLPEIVAAGEWGTFCQQAGIGDDSTRALDPRFD